MLKENLRILRNLNGYSQEQIAEKIRGLLAPFADLKLSDLRWEFERLKDAMAYALERIEARIKGE